MSECNIPGNVVEHPEAPGWDMVRKRPALHVPTQTTVAGAERMVAVG